MEPQVGSPGVEPGGTGVSDRRAADAHTPVEAPRAGLEPAPTLVNSQPLCRTELPRNERPVTEIEPSSPRRQRGVLPLDERGLEEAAGFEPARRSRAGRRSTPLP